MGINSLKKDLREKIIQYPNISGEDIWEMLDTYDKYLLEAHTSDELAEAAFLRGQISFHLGRYHDTVQALTKCISIEKTPEYFRLEEDAYNMLGMLFSFVGYETVALDNYLAAVDAAKRNRNMEGEVLALLNIGILYQGLFDYRKAMAYYKKAYEQANCFESMPRMLLLLLCLIQEAQLLCKMGKYEDAKKMKREVDSYYQVASQGEILLAKCILEVWITREFGTEEDLTEQILVIRNYLERDSDYLEQIDMYVDFCSFLLENGRDVEARQFIDILEEKLGSTEFLHLQMRMEELEIQYQKTYGSEEKYYWACLHYVEIQQEYERTWKHFKMQNLMNIEDLRELERQQMEFEFRSKCDLATGLLNKENFQYEVETYLAERNRDVTDALMIVDIDNFKLINDSYGHLVGDEVIIGLTDLLKEIFCEGEILGRFGGDEFVVFLKNIDQIESLEQEVEAFREDFSTLGFGKKENVHNTVSIGIAYNQDVNASYKTMFSCADEALLKAKEYGKNRVTFFEIKRGLLKYV